MRAKDRGFAVRVLRARGWAGGTMAASAALSLLLSLASAPTAQAQQSACRLLQVSFEPDCLVRDTTGACHLDLSHPDFGPQIAVWVESADGSTFVDTLMVTNAVALYGIANRPGRWDFRSGPKFPYGRRPMALPVWAHHRGVVYDSVTMDDGLDDNLASHESVSSPEPHFCRPMMPSEIVDAITCASGTFRSAKGIFDQTLGPSYYPPRGDLVDWGSVCVPRISGGSACDYGDARQFGLINDVDAIAAATPAYDRAFTTTWNIPATLGDGDYALWVEVGKEFDSNAAFAHTSFLTAYETEFYGQYGLDGNIGQPSVVYRVGFHVSAASPVVAAGTTAPVGYGDWTGATGTMTPLDAQISDGPGSGAGRLRVTAGPDGPNRVHAVGVACQATDCSTTPPPQIPRMAEPTANQDPAAAAFTFRQAADGNGGAVLGYEMRYQPAEQYALDESTYDRWTPAPAPAVGPPGTVATVTLPPLGPNSGYAVGLRSHGTCGWSDPAFIRLYVGAPHFKQLSGCVVATAAYGSDMDADVAVLRRARDWAVSRSNAAKVGAALYADSAPPLAALVRRSDTARAVVRALLRPFVSVTQGAATVDAATGDPRQSKR